MAMQYGGWYDNPAAGKNQRWFNGTWTDGAEPGSGGGNNNNGGGGGASMPSAPSFDPKPYDDLLKSLPSAKDFAAGLDSRENDVFGNYFKTAREQPKPLELFDMMSESAGVPQLRKSQSSLQGTIYDIEDSLRRLEPDINARTQNSVVTESQRRGMLTSAQKPIMENYGWLNQSLGRISGALAETQKDVTQRVGYALEGFRMELEPYKEQLSLVVTQNARAMTGFSTDRQTTLDVLLAKIGRQEKVTDQEFTAARELAIKEADYLQAIKLQQNTFNQPNNQIVDVGGNKVLIDMNTGRTIVNLGGKTATTGGNGKDYYNQEPQYSAPAGTIMNGYYSTGVGWVKVVQ